MPGFGNCPCLHTAAGPAASRSTRLAPTALREVVNSVDVVGHRGQALGIPLLMSVLCLTCYYYAFFFAVPALTALVPALTALVPALTALVPALGPAYLALAAGSQVLTRFHWIDDQYTAESYLFFVFGLCMLYAVSRPFSLARLKR
jgi:hypothetical protein